MDSSINKQKLSITNSSVSTLLKLLCVTGALFVFPAAVLYTIHYTVYTNKLESQKNKT